MTFLGYEKPVELGREQVFDPTTAQMVLSANRDYINAVYRDYQQAMADMKEFNEKYGNFLSPFAKDMERYSQIVGGIQNKINYLYATGNDPLRTSQGRAALTRMLAGINPAELSAMKANAKVGYAYLDAMQKLRSSGKYSQAQEDFDISVQGGPTFADFETGNGASGFNMWSRISPIEATTLRELSQDSYKGRTARMLTKADFDNDPRLSGYKFDPRYEYTGYLDSDLMKVAPGAAVSLAADPRAAFFREESRRRALAANPNATAEDIQNQWYRDIADANSWALIDPIREADKFALDDHSTANDIRAARARAAIEFEYDKKRLTDPTFVAAAGRGKKEETDSNIFREAELLTPRNYITNSPWNMLAGQHVGYVPSGQYKELIDPIIPASYVEVKDKSSGQVKQAYNFNSPNILDNLYTVDDNDVVRNVHASNNNDRKSFTFIPSGQMKAVKFAGGYRYFIMGTFKGDGSTQNVYDPKTGSREVWIEVKERGSVYDGK